MWQDSLSCLEVSKLPKFLTGFATEHCRSWYFNNIEHDLFNAAILMDIQLAGTKGLYP